MELDGHFRFGIKQCIYHTMLYSIVLGLYIYLVVNAFSDENMENPNRVDILGLTVCYTLDQLGFLTMLISSFLIRNIEMTSESAFYRFIADNWYLKTIPGTHLLSVNILNMVIKLVFKIRFVREFNSILGTTEKDANKFSPGFDIFLHLLVIYCWCYFTIIVIFLVLLVCLYYYRNAVFSNMDSIHILVASNLDDIKECLVPISKQEIQENTTNNECIICMETGETADWIATPRCPGRHIFHRDCIYSWIDKNNNSCPICRSPIMILETPVEI